MSDSDTERLIRIETMITSIATRDADHETRIRKLERALYIGIGLAAALGSAVGSLAGNVPALLS